MHTVKNSLTFVSGSTQGIGLAIARAFVENGAQVVVHGRTEAKSCEAACDKLSCNYLNYLDIKNLRQSSLSEI